MRVFLALLVLLMLTATASAQTLFDSLRGQYGSANDPATSCATNPHELDFIANPPHAIFDWSMPRLDGQGQMSSRDRYDLLDHDDTTLTLRLEGDTRRTDDGKRPIWILRLTRDPQGYCWGRTDWPIVRCEQQQVRCDNPTS